MKRLLLSLILLLLLTGCNQEIFSNVEIGLEQTSQINHEEQSIDEEQIRHDESTEHRYLPATVVRVVDGDTVNVKLENGNEETVRLLLVDTPETVHPNKPVQPFGPEASAFAKEMMPPGTKVKLELDVSERDKYGRILAYLWVDDKMFNELLLEKGFARVAYVYAPNTKYVDQFYEIQKKAQMEEVGIWSIENYATDRGFDPDAVDEKNEQANCSNPMIKGNINSKGELIYHVPGGQYYEQTKAEEMFCTEEEAIQKGYRKSQR